MGYYQLSVDAVIRELASNASIGLSTSEAEKRIKQFGGNQLAEPSYPSLLLCFLRQFQDFMVMVLIGATVISALLGEVPDALAILAIIVCNAFLGFIQEYKAERSLEALQEMVAPTCVVLRDGRETKIEAVQLVPGDIVFLTSGQRVPADGRLLDANLLAVEEATLTGESHPVEKGTEYVFSDPVPLGDRRNSVFMGTTVVRGKGRFIVTATGMGTEIGRIAAMIHAVPVEATPLQRRLEQLGKWLVAGCSLVVGVVFLVGVLQGFPIYRMFLTGVSLAVAAIPEGLPAVVTIALAMGVQRMSRRHAIVRHLPAVETLGCATVICSDKTGTLTQNVMTVREIRLSSAVYQITGTGYTPEGDILALDGHPINAVGKDLERALMAGALCNNARIYPPMGRSGGMKGLWRKLRIGNVGSQKDGEWSLIGDPTEGALLVAAAKANLYKEDLESGNRVVGELPFDSRRKRMTIITQAPGKNPMAWVKGAPDVILDLCTHIRKNGEGVLLSSWDKQRIKRNYEDMSSSALRVLALAERQLLPGTVGQLRRMSEAEIERGLTFLGLVGMIDPPRPEAVKAIASARRAGIRTILVTGDHANTAVAIACELGLSVGQGSAVSGAELEKMDDTELQRVVSHINVFARVQPEHKVRIVRALKAQGEIVGMTGDGVNDGPAVKEADIGIAMGKVGTDVSREASDIVLADDNFATIVAAIEEGRAIYDNIRKFIRYLLGCNVGEVLTMLFATLVGLPLPLLPIQILWMNLVTDGLPAIALSVDPGDPDIMERSPRSPEEGIFARGLYLRIASQGLLIGICSLMVFVLELFWGSGKLECARTMAFSALVMSQLLFVFQCRSEHHRVWEVGLLGNPWLLGAVIVSTAMHLAVLYIPTLQPIFKTVPLVYGQWALVLFFSGLCAVWGDVAVSIYEHIRRRLTWIRV
ncbi:MAG: cation-translocating P-type ATPase [Firmicutes bacterium]|nr:cation-translocating P-type ATPase [Bacillota bacterium]